jgi:two-component system capsular synthesis sensor histidine kinase RcsC
VCVYDAASGKIMNNPEAVLLLGQPAETTLDERRSAKYRVVRHGVEVPFEQFPLLRSLNGEEVHGEELDLIFPARRRSLLVSAAPIRNTEGKIEGSISAFTDISILKELQSELDSRRRAAEEQSVRKSRFLAQVSHDIRNPANTISLLAELLYRTAAQHDGASEVSSIAGDLRKNALSLVDLVSDVLDLTRFDSGRIELEETEFSLTEMLTEECRGYREMASEKGLDFECILPPGNVLVRTDRVKLSRVLGNLLSNALKFTETGSVKLSAVILHPNGKGSELELSVCDTGPGVPAEFQDRIFDEFFQIRKSSDSSRGAGLGLAICKRLIQAMGGSIWVQSQPGQGSTFFVHLPASTLVRM